MGSLAHYWDADVVCGWFVDLLSLDSFKRQIYEGLKELDLSLNGFHLDQSQSHHHMIGRMTFFQFSHPGH